MRKSDSILFLSFVLCLLWFGCGGRGYASPRDSLSVEERNQRFYDSLRMKSNRRALPRLMHELLIVSPGQKDDDHAVDETVGYERYAKRRIARVEIDCQNIYDVPGKSFWQRAANATHMVTRQRTIRKDLLFEAGDRVDPEILVKNQQLLQSRSYIYDAEIRVEPMPEDTMTVIVKIITRDSWTISVDGDVGLNGRMTGKIYDANLLGSGNRFSYQLGVDWSKPVYEGSMFEYDMPNIFGTFVQGHLVAGRSYDRIEYSARLDKQFILPSDFGIGLKYESLSSPYYMLAADSTFENLSYRLSEFWIGRSYYIPSMRSSFYMAGRFSDVRYDRRADVSEVLNPAFHNTTHYLASIGFYRERFYASTLMYGFGFKEYIASGFRAELVGGYVNGEFHTGWYGGMSLAAGGFTRIGYLHGRVALGSYYRFTDNHLYRSALSMGIDYCTNLLKSGRYRVRQFLSWNFLKGWNRQQGCEEVVTFTFATGPRGFDDYAVGRNRMVVNTETVLFTPWRPLGFNVAFFGFLDAGLLGNDANIFRNQLYSTFGIGVRLKNERLIFSTIQLRLGLAVGREGWLKNEWCVLSSEQRMESFRYIPSSPQVIDYR